MGCVYSEFDAACRDPDFKLNMVQYRAMKMSTGDIRSLFYSFREVDMDGSGSIGLAELLAFVDLPRTKFTEKIFSIFDDDKSGEVDFKEFVLALWNYCTLTSATLDNFAFDLYDTDGGGFLNPAEVLAMIEDIFGKNDMKTNIQAKAVAAELQAFADNMETFNVKRFHEYIKTHQAMLFPAFQMQLALQRRFLGVAYWERNADKRIELSKGKYIGVEKFLLSRGDRIAPEGQQQEEYDGPYSEAERAMHEAAGNRAAQEKRDMKAKNMKWISPQNKDARAHARDGNLARPAVGSTFTESAKLRWAASVQSVSGAMGGGRDSKRKGKTNKVYVTATSSNARINSTSSTSLNTPSVHNSTHSHSRHGHSDSSGDLYKTVIAANWNNDHAGIVLNKHGTLTMTPSQSPRDTSMHQLSDFVPRRMSRGSREHSGVDGHLNDFVSATNSVANRSKNNSFNFDNSIGSNSLNFEDWHDSPHNVHNSAHAGSSHGSSHGHHKDKHDKHHHSDKDSSSPDRPRRNSNSHSHSNTHSRSNSRNNSINNVADHIYGSDGLNYAHSHSTGADGHKLSSGRGGNNNHSSGRDHNSSGRDGTTSGHASGTSTPNNKSFVIIELFESQESHDQAYPKIGKLVRKGTVGEGASARAFAEAEQKSISMMMD